MNLTYEILSIRASLDNHLVSLGVPGTRWFDGIQDILGYLGIRHLLATDASKWTATCYNGRVILESNQGVNEFGKVSLQNFHWEIAVRAFYAKEPVANELGDSLKGNGLETLNIY